MIPRAFLRPETYFVTLATYVHNQFVIDPASDCFSFVVQDGGSKYAASEGVAYGCVFAPCNWSVGCFRIDRRLERGVVEDMQC